MACTLVVVLAAVGTLQECHGLSELFFPAPAPGPSVEYHSPPGEEDNRPYMVVFGDSHSDNGTGAYPLTTDYISKNLQALVPLISPVSKQTAEAIQATLGAGNQPPYYRHSSSNGPIWAQYLSGLLSMPLVDYAVSGATSGGTSAKTPFVQDECGGIPLISEAVTSMLNNRPAVPSLLEQVHSYVKQVGPNGASPRAVYFIEAGNNDIYDFVLTHADSSPSLSEMSTLATGIGTAVYKSLVQLYSVGARKFVVFDMGMASGIPQIRKQGPAAEKMAEKLGNATNAAIKAAVNAFVSGTNSQSSVGGSNNNGGGGGDDVNVQVIVFPISLVLGNLLGGYPQNGLANIDDPCYNNTAPSFSQPNTVCARPQAHVCKHPNQYLYWDSFHYTTAVHRNIAQNLAGYVSTYVDPPTHD